MQNIYLNWLEYEYTGARGAFIMHFGSLRNQNWRWLTGWMKDPIKFKELIMDILTIVKGDIASHWANAKKKYNEI